MWVTVQGGCAYIYTKCCTCEIFCWHKFSRSCLFFVTVDQCQKLNDANYLPFNIFSCLLFLSLSTIVKNLLTQKIPDLWYSKKCMHTCTKKLPSNETSHPGFSITVLRVKLGNVGKPHASSFYIQPLNLLTKPPASLMMLYATFRSYPAQANHYCQTSAIYGSIRTHGRLISLLRSKMG